MIYRILFISGMLIFYSCKKSGEKPVEEPVVIDDTFIAFTGTVIDQITREPVSGANVYYGYRPFNEIDATIRQIGSPVLSGADGSFNISVFKKIYSDQSRYPSQLIYASKNNYIGSSIGIFSDKKVLLYHPAELNIHVVNDTINNQTDNINIWMIGESGFWGYPGFIGRLTQGWFLGWSKACSGRKFDSVFVVKQLWGNLKYTVGGGSSYQLAPPTFNVLVTLKPDTITHFDVSY